MTNKYRDLFGVLLLEVGFLWNSGVNGSILDFLHPGSNSWLLYFECFCCRSIRGGQGACYRFFFHLYFIISSFHICTFFSSGVPSIGHLSPQDCSRQPHAPVTSAPFLTELEKLQTSCILADKSYLMFLLDVVFKASSEAETLSTDITEKVASCQTHPPLTKAHKNQ